MLFQSLHMELSCVQRHGAAVMEEVNCTEVASIPWTSGLVQTRTESALLLLKTHSGAASGAGQASVSTFPSFLFSSCFSCSQSSDFLVVSAESLSAGEPTDLRFEDDGSAVLGKTKPSTPQRVGQSVRSLCTNSDPQLVGHGLLTSFFLCDFSFDVLLHLTHAANH